jgi:3'-phosphoadenosine 5'-phosphosulfate sulfotransferase (PAPS reductase)/FAD synthetase
LQSHKGVLPDYCRVVFCNTGKEMQQTLDFVKDCQENWGIDIDWLELYEIDNNGYKPSEDSRD